MIGEPYRPECTFQIATGPAPFSGEQVPYACGDPAVTPIDSNGDAYCAEHTPKEGG